MADVLFTPSEARAFTRSGLHPLEGCDDAALVAAEVTVRATFESACRTAFAPRTVTETLDGQRGSVLRVSQHNPALESPRRPLTLTAASIDAIPLTAPELAAVRAHGDGRLVRTDGGTWSSASGYQDLAVSVTYTWGWAAVPPEILEAALVYAVRLLAQGEAPNAQQDWAETGPVGRWPYPGQRPHWTGDDYVDAVLGRFEEDRVVVA